MTNTNHSVWQKVFDTWPADVPRRGVLLTVLGEAIPFDGFAASPEFLFLDRTTPDTTGARKILLTYNQVAMLKYTDVIKPKSLSGLGFVVPGGK